MFLCLGVGMLALAALLAILWLVRDAEPDPEEIGERVERWRGNGRCHADEN